MMVLRGGLPGRYVFDLSVSGRPWALEVVGGWEKTKNKKQRGAGGPALRIRPRREKNPDLDHEIHELGSKPKSREWIF